MGLLVLLIESEAVTLLGLLLVFKKKLGLEDVYYWFSAIIAEVENLI
jgi:hypothetical protein